ncbi:MAG: MarR family transcriptional regulator [Rudaea sp.]|uniref:MarR family winged helix-turn-helix transcriptional regulator n=1 Tax=Rudaea sp. TaxID=2136325 RepID=UPI0039E4197D
MNRIPAIKELRDDANFALLIRQIREGQTALLERELGALGVELNYSQFLVLKLLAKYGQQMPGDVARCLDHNAGAMTRLLDRLESKGYLRRRPHAEDRRALTVELTEAGHAVWESINRRTDRLQAIAFQDLKESERKQLLDLLRRVRDTLEKLT